MTDRLNKLAAAAADGGNPRDNAANRSGTPVGSGTTPQVSPVGNDDTRELVARLAGVVLLLAEDHGSGIMRSECEAIIAAARKAGSQ